MFGGDAMCGDGGVKVLSRKAHGKLNFQAVPDCKSFRPLMFPLTKVPLISSFSEIFPAA
jgi:hypothetical protein